MNGLIIGVRPNQALLSTLIRELYCFVVYSNSNALGDVSRAMLEFSHPLIRDQL